MGEIKEVNVIYEAISNFVFLIACFAFGYVMGVALIYLAQNKDDEE
jgi:hypothetical protein